MITLYCRADEASLSRILAAGLQNTEPETASLETRQDFKALWLQRKAPSGGPYVVKVKLDCKLEELDAFDGRPDGKSRAEWLIPVDLIHARGSIQVSGSR